MAVEKLSRHSAKGLEAAGDTEALTEKDVSAQAKKATAADPFSLAPASLPKEPFTSATLSKDNGITKIWGEDRNGPSGTPDGLLDTLRMERTAGRNGPLLESATRSLSDGSPDDGTVTMHQRNTDQDPQMDVQAITTDFEGYTVTQQITDAHGNGEFGAHDYFRTETNGDLTLEGWDHTGDGNLTKADLTPEAALKTLQKHMESQITAENPTGDRLDKAGLQALAQQGGILGDAAKRAKPLWEGLDQAQNPQDKKDGFVGAGDIQARLAKPAKPAADASVGGAQELDGQMAYISNVHKDKANDISSYLEGRARAATPGSEQNKFREGAQAVGELVDSYAPKKGTQQLNLLGDVRSVLEKQGLWGDRGVQAEFRNAETQAIAKIREFLSNPDLEAINKLK